ncbi:PLP-dependent aminotransferase family protein [Undibacterium sp. Jales W-56]|uniref:MocR-like pyridoxine biosynthesis transcription factor PdxR n=1 Tax=Undibacterium sp. Jales W-56 TaxID=2897325 RepID=UPI0021D2D747|nr:PLP-dependent aminotransferase family protein [Undibacterium sp. Jales W-56]MCU6434081.1 PLP-dependent aminotransferase family protein [Undibacterium sp. Jales W-56]
MPRRPQAVDLPPISGLDRSSGHLGRQLTYALREAIRSGNLKPGDLLPSSRQLASALDIARGTVTEAYEQLIAEGFLDAQPRAGTRVAAALTQSRSAASSSQKPAAKATSASLPAPAAAFAKVAEQFKPLPPVPFAVSVPTGPAAPDEAWRRLGNRIRARGPGAPSGYDDPQGVKALREAVAEYVRRSRSVQCSAEQVIITTGTQQGLYVACQVLLGATDIAWVEDPAYRGITGILESTGRQDRMVRVPVDDAGIDVDAGVAMAKDARAAFVTPSHQYPLGMPMSMGRRNALLAWARKNGAWIVEDDYDSELRYAGHPFPSLQGLAPDRVVYLGTFSKILFPSLRLGYAIVPDALVPAFCGARVLMDRHTPSADQHVLAAFITEGYLDRHIRRIRGVYADRRSQLLGMLERWIPKDLGWLQPSDQGMHLVLWLADGIDDVLLASRAVEAGVAVRAVSPMYSEGNGRSGLVLGLGGFSNEQMEAAVRILAAISMSMRKTKPHIQTTS